MKNYAFMAGLPRSGSTLLSSILSQNPEIYSGPDSPVCDLMFNVERNLINASQYVAYPKPKVVPATIFGLIENYYSDISKPLVIDKSRTWSLPEHFDTLKRNLPYKPKILMPVRPVIEILASFIDLVHRNPSSVSFIDKEMQSRQELNPYRQIDELRCDHLMRPKGLIDNCIYGIVNAVQPQNREHFYFVDYDELVNNPIEVMDGVYNFLEIKKFDHNFDLVVNNTHEDDIIYGLHGMHDVRSKVSRRQINPVNVLTPYVIQKYSGSDMSYHYGA